jgi:N-acetylglucosaminyldiphosphoundecaprenol N-acetyl-beta-D-mannosaminyltransferase
MGLLVDQVTEREVIARIIDEASAGRGGRVITPNLDQLRLYHELPELRSMYRDATLVVADGMPLVWASRLQKTPLPERVAGATLMLSLTTAAAEAGLSVFLLGGKCGVAQAAAKELKGRSANLSVAGTLCPAMGFEKSPAEIRAILQALRDAKPDIVYVGLGFPKQEHLIARLRRILPRAWFLGVGVSFSFVSGDLRRAPQWVQKSSLEWAHRLCQEPGRLSKRYLIHDLPFAFRLFAHAIGRRARARSLTGISSGEA